MKTIVIGDIHGCYEELQQILLRVYSEWDFTLGEDKLVFLGDYIDRGPNSKAVIDHLMAMQYHYGIDKIVCLKGNHEDMCLHAYKMYGEESEGLLGEAWYYNGGGNKVANAYKNEQVSDGHLQWMLNLPVMHEDEYGIYVHAGLLPLLGRDTDDFHKMWVRHEFIYTIHDFGKTVFFGHTVQRNTPLIEDNKVGVDTGCVYGYKLTAMNVETLEFIQEESCSV